MLSKRRRWWYWWKQRSSRCPSCCPDSRSPLYWRPEGRSCPSAAPRGTRPWSCRTRGGWPQAGKRTFLVCFVWKLFFWTFWIFLHWDRENSSKLWSSRFIETKDLVLVNFFLGGNLFFVSDKCADDESEEMVGHFYWDSFILGSPERQMCRRWARRDDGKAWGWWRCLHPPSKLFVWVLNCEVQEIYFFWELNPRNAAPTFPFPFVIFCWKLFLLQ